MRFSRLPTVDHVCCSPSSSQSNTQIPSHASHSHTNTSLHDHPNILPPVTPSLFGLPLHGLQITGSPSTPGSTNLPLRLSNLSTCQPPPNLNQATHSLLHLFEQTHSTYLPKPKQTPIQTQCHQPNLPPPPLPQTTPATPTPSPANPKPGQTSKTETTKANWTHHTRFLTRHPKTSEQ